MVGLANTPVTYGWVSRGFHWLIAVLIFGLIWLGWWMVDLSYYHPWYNAALIWHKELGLIVLALVAAKMLWHLKSRPPGLSDGLTGIEKRGARAVHRSLLALALVIPLTGYIVTTSDGKPVEMFGWFDIPAVLAESKSIRDLAIDLHFWLAYGTIAIAGLHAAAALKHQFINRDGTLRRMV